MVETYAYLRIHLDLAMHERNREIEAKQYNGYA